MLLLMSLLEVTLFVPPPSLPDALLFIERNERMEVNSYFGGTFDFSITSAYCLIYIGVIDSLTSLISVVYSMGSSNDKLD
jgi:hypothetical protein